MMDDWDSALAGVEPEDLGPIEVTEDGVARRFTAIYAKTMRFDHDLGRWFEWTDDDHWQEDGAQRAFDYCRRLAREASEEAAAAKLEKTRKAGFATGVEKFARADPCHALEGSKTWDDDVWLLGCPGVTVDLRTGVARAPDPNDHITKLTAVAPAMEASHPIWTRFIEEATGDDDSLGRLLQAWAGYCLTGSTREHALMFVFGDGGNGKSVFLNTLTGILGAYATAASMDTFTASRFERHTTDLADLRGARLVAVSEVTEGKAWDEQRIKALTGGDLIKARFMRQDNFTFRPQFKLVVVGNHHPVLRSVDDAMRRRFNLVPFTRKPRTVDPDLEAKLRTEWPAILGWMIRGCADWLAEGLTRPASVVAATEAYFSDQDLFGQWLQERCELVTDRPHATAASELFASWKAYTEAAGERPGTARRLGDMLARQGFERAVEWRNGGSVRVWKGIRLV